MTNYSWLTWADILATHYAQKGMETYNYGLSGTGNTFILSSLIRADLKHRFTSDDVIMIMWSSWSRLDMYTRLMSTLKVEKPVRPTWCQFGNILNAEVETDPDYTGNISKTPVADYVDTWWSLEDDAIKGINAIYAANKMYNISFQGTIDTLEGVKETTTDPLIKQLNNIFPDNIPNYVTEVEPESTEHPVHHEYFKYIQGWDGHPIPIIALNWVNKHIMPRLDTELDQSTIREVQNYTQKVVDDLREAQVQEPFDHQATIHNVSLLNLSEYRKRFNMQSTLENGFWDRTDNKHDTRDWRILLKEQIEQFTDYLRGR